MMLFENTKEGIDQIVENIQHNETEFMESQSEIDKENIYHLWEPLDSPINDDYEFANHSIVFYLFSNLLYIIAYPILFLLNKIVFNFRIVGKENLDCIKTGKITIANHINPLDCTMMGITNFPNKVYFTSLENNFKIPVIKQIITLLNAIPIPRNKKYFPKFIAYVDNLLQRGKTVHFYPEGYLHPYCKDLRPFKRGAFNFAVRNQVPIIPCVFKYVKVTGFRRFVKKKPFIYLKILKPIYPDTSLPKEFQIQDLKNRVFNAMNES